MKLDAKGAKYARFAIRGCLTRLALCFDGKRKYTGEEVQSVLLRAMMSLDGLEKSLTDEIVQGAFACLQDQELELQDHTLPGDICPLCSSLKRPGYVCHSCGYAGQILITDPTPQTGGGS